MRHRRVDGDDESELDVSYCQRGVAAEVVHYAERAAVRERATHLPRPVFHEREHCTVRFARMYRRGLRDPLRCLELPSEDAYLCVSRGEVAVEIEADLADHHDAWMPRKLFERIEISVARILRIVRMNSGRCEDLAMLFSEVDREAA